MMWFQRLKYRWKKLVKEHNPNHRIVDITLDELLRRKYEYHAILCESREEKVRISLVLQANGIHWLHGRDEQEVFLDKNMLVLFGGWIASFHMVHCMTSDIMCEWWRIVPEATPINVNDLL